MKRALPFTDEHNQFREMAKKFFDTEVMPHHEKWEKEGRVSREIWKKAGDYGLLCPDVSADDGGGGVDFLYNTIIIEETSRCGNSGFFISLHNDINMPYFMEYANAEQKKRWIPGFASGELISAIS